MASTRGMISTMLGHKSLFQLQDCHGTISSRKRHCISPKPSSVRYYKRNAVFSKLLKHGFLKHLVRLIFRCVCDFLSVVLCGSTLIFANNQDIALSMRQLHEWT